MTQAIVKNRLDEETSPYLKQHADNPVHWQAWNDAALELARAQRKPILLSVGYSACHWCHVMAHESFEDPETAALMNELYVNIKVDREERPDLDKIYQTAHQLFTGQAGGWPLTVFLTPDEHLPIFTGTFFPKERLHGMPPFRDVLKAVAAYASTRSDEVKRRGASLLDALNGIAAESADDLAALSSAPLATARAQLAESYDAEHGGFGGAPKFPHPTSLELLLETWHANRSDADALAMVRHSLDRMALGGLYDQLGGGFFRYCVDRHWGIPHFEKMLYDNAALLALYADAYAATRAPLYARVAAETAAWVQRDLRDAHGAFYATLDADSEGEEGKYYVWTDAELARVLTPDELALARRAFAIDGKPNFEGHAWHLARSESFEAERSDTEQSAHGAAAASSDERGAAAASSGERDKPGERDEPRREPEALARVRAKLLAERVQRVPPGRDDKVIASWNGLMIFGLARAARRLERPDLAAAAAQAADFLREHLLVDGRLLAVHKDGRARFPAYLDDHAFIACALVELLQCRWRAADLELACTLLDTLLERFADPRGGFFFTADDHEALLHRPKPLPDEAVPSGNGMAARALLALGHLLGNERYLAAAEAAIRAAWHALERYPQAHATLLSALRLVLVPPRIVVARAAPQELARWQRVMTASYEPQRFAFAIPDDADAEPALGAASRQLLALRAVRAGGVAYVCEGTHCRAPVTSVEELERAL